MPQDSDQDQLLAQLTIAYQRHSSIKLYLAIAFVSLLSLGLGGLIFLIFSSLVWAIIAVFAVGLIALNLAIVFVLPPSSKLHAARDLIYTVACEPARVRVFDSKRIHILDESGEEFRLTGFEQQIWRSLVVPYFVKQYMRDVKEDGGSSGRRMTSSERRYLEGLRDELEKTRGEIDEKRRALNAKQKAIEARARDLDEREARIGGNDESA